MEEIGDPRATQRENGTAGRIFIANEEQRAWCCCVHMNVGKRRGKRGEVAG